MKNPPDRYAARCSPARVRQLAASDRILDAQAQLRDLALNFQKLFQAATRSLRDAQAVLIEPEPS